VLSLYLVRHGETAWNRERRYQGHLDVELSDLGRAQAAALARRLAGVPFDAGWASDLSRCAETLRLILGDRPVPVCLEPDLREAHLGEWQGRLIAEVRAEGRGDGAAPRGEEWAPAGGESARQLRERVVGCLGRLAAAHPTGHVLVVSHGGALRAYLASLLGLDFAARGRFRIDNVSLSLVELASEPRVRLLNDLRHLGGRFSSTGAITTA
jgi:broad specificity phosphatase PhoE